jgi:transposase-like protein
MTEQNSEVIACKDCGSTAVVKFGTYKGVQRYWCKSCQRKFKGDNALFHMKVSHEHISSALSMYYEGMSIGDICRHLKQEHDYYPPKSVVYQWIVKYTEAAIKQFKNYHPQVGETWIADETVLSVAGHNVWLYDIIDEKTRFLLASRLTLSRTTHDAEMLMKEAQRKAGKSPKEVITDKNSSYLDGIELTFGRDTEHITSHGFTVKPNTNLIERFHGTLKDRTKIMRGLKTKETAQLILDGWLIHYNYFRGHEGLDGKTPAEKAKVQLPFKNWLDVVKVPQVRVVIPQARLLRTSLPRITPRTPRITPKTPRVSRRFPEGGLYVSKERAMSRHYFKGARRVA